MAVEYGTGRVATNGLILALDAADKNSYSGSGTTWRDMSGNSNNGTLTGGPPTFNSGNGGSIVFNGTNDYVAFTDSNLLPTLGLTISVWFKTTVGNKWLVDKSAGAVINGYNFIGTSSGAIQISVNSIGIQSGASTANTGNWTFACGVWIPSTSLTMYLNDAVAGTVTTSIPASINDPSFNLQLGRRSTSNPRDFWNGSLANLMIYNRALSAAEILQNYNATKSRFGL